jgi:hypothetical protein
MVDAKECGSDEAYSQENGNRVKDSNTPMEQDALFKFLDYRLRTLLLLLLPPPPPGQVSDGSMALYPDGHTLGELDSTVLTLAVIEGKKVPATRWKAYKRVDKRWPKYHLVSRVEKLVRRARARLREENEADCKVDCAQYHQGRREAFLEWIAWLENPDFLDVITIAPDPRWLPRYVVNTMDRAHKLLARYQGAKRAARYRAKRKGQNRRKISRQKA